MRSGAEVRLPERLFADTLASPPGPILIVFDERETLRALYFEDRAERMHRMLALHYGAMAVQPHKGPAAILDPLGRYFAGDLAAVDSICWGTRGTDFQRSVWAALTEIGPSTTLGYGALAARLGMPKAARAVGLANGANPISIVVPCHRVIGANGALTGYGGGLERKLWLLRHEGVADRQTDLFA